MGVRTRKLGVTHDPELAQRKSQGLDVQAGDAHPTGRSWKPGASHERVVILGSSLFTPNTDVLEVFSARLDGS